MITFPLFTELEKHRDEANENFHRNIRPQLVERLKAFGFETVKTDGHDIDEIIMALKTKTNGKPLFVCAKTIKGKGVPFMENQFGWHGKAIGDEDYNNAMKALEV